MDETPLSAPPVIYASFPQRRDRAEFIASHYRDFIRGDVLDVGCDEGHIRELVPGIHYTGIDVGGKPDLTVDLEKTERLPFDDNAFHCLICSDVLEHLDSLHRTFGELVRVCRGHIIISLPNNWVNARQPIERGHGSFSHYGLPAERPMDRHKWFFSLADAQTFYYAQEKKYPIRVQDCFAMEKPRPALVRAARRLRYPNRRHYLNRYAHTLWVRYTKTGAVE